MICPQIWSWQVAPDWWNPRKLFISFWEAYDCIFWWKAVKVEFTIHVYDVFGFQSVKWLDQPMTIGKPLKNRSNNFVTNYYFIFRCPKSRKEVKKCFQITSKLWHKQCDKNIMNISFKCSVRRSEWLGLVLS